MNRIKGFFAKFSPKVKKGIAATAAAVMALMVTAFPAFASEDGTSGAVGALDSATLGTIESAFTNVKTDVLAIVGKALPVALAIMGVILAITLGVKFFKRAAK